MSKKAAKNQSKEQTYEFRDIVLAKVRGFPAWPGMVVDPDSVPSGVAKERPNAKSKKGQWYCVRFFPAGDYAWMVPKDMSKLQQHEIQAYIDEPYKRSGELLAGYKVALDPKKWEEDREAAQAEAAEAEANAEVDQLEESEGGGDGEDEDKPKNKKRKRDSDAAAAKTKSKAKPKKEPAEPKKKAANATKNKKNGIKSRALVESEDEAGADDEDAGPSKKTSPPPNKKQKKADKDDDDNDALSNDPEATKVRDWRHKLQKAFLGKIAPKDEDMPGLDQLFTTVESYENMSIQYLTVSHALCYALLAPHEQQRKATRLSSFVSVNVFTISHPQFSKIGKVMRHINALGNEKVPRDDEFKFRTRAKALVDRWHKVLEAAKPEVRKPATNGKHAEDSGAKAKENGKEESPAQGTDKADTNAMEVDKNEEDEADAPAEDDAPADGAADESADAEMSEPAAA
ncbi:hypothetical protein BDW22DRAFT_805853 [Trametopsis cervina]|nr:hypothetical protein BDW22DRAFT_805853 [Trametopsis cervina]